MKIGQPEKMIVRGKRLDGRKPEELRKIKIEAGVLKRADGSARVEWGDNVVMAAVYGPRELHPRHLQVADKAFLRFRYNMAPFSVSDRKRPGPDRRSVEISKVSREALEPVVFTHLFPKTGIDVFIEVLRASAGTRCVGITAASVALADAGVPMRDLVQACAAGKVDGTVVLDPFDIEDNFGEADLPIATVQRTGDISLLQMDGHLTQAEFKKALELAKGGCEKIYALQKEALSKRYQS